MQPCNVEETRVINAKGYIVTGHQNHWDTCPNKPKRKEDRDGP